MPNSLPMYVHEAPAYEARDGQMFISMDGADLVMPIHACMEAMRRCQAALDEWRIAQSGKVEILDHWRDHAASS